MCGGGGGGRGQECKMYNYVNGNLSYLAVCLQCTFEWGFVLFEFMLAVYL